MMDDKQFQRLLKKVQSDETLFHNLVFSPADAMEELGFLDAAERETLLKVSPDSVIKGIVSGKGRASDCGVTVQCGTTCTHTSSLQNEMMRGLELAADCGVTVQCTSTCGHTSSVAENFGMQDLASDIRASIQKRSKG
jgi:hypothetical protein